jgi:hypothetical protein
MCSELAAKMGVERLGQRKERGSSTNQRQIVRETILNLIEMIFLTQKIQNHLTFSDQILLNKISDGIKLPPIIFGVWISTKP